MLVRLLIKNLFSFQDLTEFNMLPGRFNRMPDHIYETGGLEVLKLNAIYGANGAGKSNLIKAMALLKRYLEQGTMPVELLTETFKFDPASRGKDLYLGVEFIKDGETFYYGLTINKGIIVEEELQISGIGKKDDYLLFQRTDKPGEAQLDLNFCKEVMKDEEASIFPFFLKNEILDRAVPVLFHMASRKNKVFTPFKQALDWFTHDLVTLLPGSMPNGLPVMIEQHEQLYDFTSLVMKTFNTGINKIEVETIPIQKFFGEDDRTQAERISSELMANPSKTRSIRTEYEEVVFVNQNGQVVAKRLLFMHDFEGTDVVFTAAQESDGTRRMLQYLPAFYAMIHHPCVFLVDEIERSIHPLLIKELIQKFSHDDQTNGQLIFSTHESNLLDQQIFRPDEIWFAEKNKQGATELYPLSDFKEHHTIDIRKGYLNGRYGGIPFLGNLKDLKWDHHAETEQVQL